MENSYGICQSSWQGNNLISGQWLCTG